jgi:hypothetical protein
MVRFAESDTGKGRGFASQAERIEMNQSSDRPGMMAHSRYAIGRT